MDDDRPGPGDEPCAIVVTAGPFVGVERFLHDTHRHRAVIMASLIRLTLRDHGYEDFKVEIVPQEETR